MLWLHCHQNVRHPAVTMETCDTKLQRGRWYFIFIPFKQIRSCFTAANYIMWWNIRLQRKQQQIFYSMLIFNQRQRRKLPSETAASATMSGSFLSGPSYLCSHTVVTLRTHTQHATVNHLIKGAMIFIDAFQKSETCNNMEHNWNRRQEEPILCSYSWSSQDAESWAQIRNKYFCKYLYALYLWSSVLGLYSK